MRNKTTLLYVFCLTWLLAATETIALAQHEGHDRSGSVPATESPLPGSKGDESVCQRVARLAAELERDFELLASTSDPAELQRRLAEHRLKLQALRAATEACSQQREKPFKRNRRGCGHRWGH